MSETLDLTALQTLQRAKWTTEKRKQYLKDHPENFAGPDGSFPIEDGSDVGDAWGLAGHAANPDAVRAKIKSIAKRLGLSASLPDTAKEDDNKERAMTAPVTIDPTDTHEPINDAHDNDNEHSEERATPEQTTPEPTTLTPESLYMYAPIARVDEKDWVIEGQATSEAQDFYGTIFEYESSKRAFQRWMQRGNIREQHDPRKAVGKALAVEFDDANKAIYVRARISKGARDTWEKILDGTLTGFSIGVPTISAKKRFIQRAGKSVPMYYDHDLNELSVVDAPGSPNCDIAIARADGMITDIVDDVVEDAPPEQTTPEPQAEPLERAGKSISAANGGKMHESIGHTLMAVRSQLQTHADTGCADCQAALKQMDPDNDGDIDAFGGAFGDTDGDAAALSAGDDDMERHITGIVERVLSAQLAPVYARLQGIAGTLARSTGTSNTTTALETTITGAITRAIETVQSASDSQLAEVRASLGAVREQVETIARQPMPGAPIMHAGTTPRAQQANEKRLPTDPYQAPTRSGSAVYDAIRQMAEAGQLDTPDRQADAIAAGLIAQRQGR